MPIYGYKTKEERRGCEFCRKGFEVIQSINDKPIEVCPQCGAEVRRIISGFSFGFSKSGLDRKAREKGFHKLKKVDKGRYERLY